MPDPKGLRSSETRPRAADPGPPAGLDEQLRELDDLLELLGAKASMFSGMHARAVMRAARELVARRLEDAEAGAPSPTSEESAARVQSAWRLAMIEAQGRARRGPTAPEGETGREAGDEPLADAGGPIPTFGPARLDEQGRLVMPEEERRARAEAAARALEAIRRLPDDDPPGAEAEFFRAIDAGRPHRPLFADPSDSR